MILIGSCSRSKLLRSFEARVGQEARQVEANQRIKTAIEDADRRFKMVDKQRAELRLNGQDETNGNLSNGRANGSVGKEDMEATGRPRLHSATGRFTIVPVSINASSSMNTAPPAEKQSGSGQSSPKSKSGHSDGGHDVYHTIGDMLRSVTHFSMGRFGRGRKHSHSNDDYDLSGDERKACELERLSGRIDLDAIGVDPAPFQLVEHSSLFKRRWVSMDQSNSEPGKTVADHSEGKLMTVEDEDGIQMHVKASEFICGDEDSAPSRACGGNQKHEASSSGEDSEAADIAPHMLRSRSEPFT
ncbi:Protein CLH-3 a, partial [Aphelenchoides avenae]